jgi:hypothetical protein
MPVPHSSVFGMYQVETPWNSGPNVRRAVVASVVFAAMWKTPWPPIRQAILVSVPALIGSGAKTSAHRLEPLTSASAGCGDAGRQSKACGAETSLFPDDGFTLAVGGPDALSGPHPIVMKRPAAMNAKTPSRNTLAGTRFSTLHIPTGPTLRFPPQGVHAQGTAWILICR